MSDVAIAFHAGFLAGVVAQCAVACLLTAVWRRK